MNDHLTSDTSERAVLATVLLRDTAALEAAAILRASDFATSYHRVAFAAVTEMALSGKGVDLVTLTQHLHDTGNLAKAGGAAYLAELSGDAIRGTNLEHHCATVRERSRRRQLLAVLQSASERLNQESEPTEQVIAQVETQLPGIVADEMSDSAMSVAQITAGAIEEISALRNYTGDVIGLPSGIQCVDKMTTGYRKGEVVVIGGRPGQGKSSLAIEAAIAASSDGRPVMLFSLEMSCNEVLRRVWSQVGRFSHLLLRDPRRMSNDDWTRLALTADKVQNWPLYINDSSAMTETELVARARLAVRRHKVELVIVDYVQLVDSKAHDERERMNRVSEALRKLAKQENVAVVVLSQLARPKDGAENERPTMYRLKESGNLEQDAHCVLLLFRPVVEGEFTGDDEIIVAKQRNGPLGSLPITFLGETMRFVERENFTREDNRQ